MQTDRIPKMRAHGAIKLITVHRQIHAAIAVQHGESKGDGRTRNVGTADVQQPGDAVRQGQDSRLGVNLAQARADACSLGLGRLTCNLGWMNADRAHGRRRLVGPDRVHGIRLEGDQFGPGRFGGLAQLLDFVQTVEPWIEAKLVAFAQRIAQPTRDGCLVDGHNLEDFADHLARRLERITTVDEDRCAFAQDHGGSRRAREPGQPGQPLVPRCDVLALMGVRSWDNEPGGTRIIQHRAQCCDPGRGRLLVH